VWHARAHQCTCHRGGSGNTYRAHARRSAAGVTHMQKDRETSALTRIASSAGGKRQQADRLGRTVPRTTSHRMPSAHAGADADFRCTTLMTCGLPYGADAWSLCVVVRAATGYVLSYGCPLRSLPTIATCTGFAGRRKMPHGLHHASAPAIRRRGVQLVNQPVIASIGSSSPMLL
jgi:hypothetical protein